MASNEKITVLARIKAKPGLEDRVRQEMMGLVEPTRREPGCINYDLHRACENASEFILYENWRSRQDLDDHLQMPYLQSFKQKAGELLAEPLEITLWEMISTPQKK